MRHRTTSARALLALTLAGGLAAIGATAAHAGPRKSLPVKLEGTVDNKFNPADLTAAPGTDGKVTVEFTSHGYHTFQSDEASFSSGPVQDATKTVTFAAKPGTYQFYCLFHKDQGMRGTLTVAAAGAPSSSNPAASPSATAPPVAPASASASASVGAPQPGVGAPTASATGEAPPGVEGNATLRSIEEERAAQHGAVSGFRFFSMVGVAFLVILGAAVTFSTRPRRASGR